MEVLPFRNYENLNLKQMGKKRILEQMIRRIHRPKMLQMNETSHGTTTQKFSIMLVDSASLKVLSSFCDVYDLLEEGVTVVEDIGKNRQCMPNLDAIYFISPTMESINILCDDFKNEEKPHYNEVHVFFTLPIENESIFSKVAYSTGLLKRLKSFVEFNLGFIAFERRVFHFDHVDPLVRIFPSNRAESLSCINKLISLFLTLGDKPIIRFHSNKRQLNEGIAVLLFNRLTQYKADNLTTGRTTLLIVDRSIDLPPLFIHEYTYQAYIYDMLNVRVHSTVTQKNEEASPVIEPADTIEYTILDNDNNNKICTALLNENDHVYNKYKHQHIMVAMKQIPQEIKKFLAENAAASLANKKNMTNEEMGAAIRHLPQYHEMLDKFNAHHSITHRCFTEYVSKNLAEAGRIEQDLASGVTAKGKHVSSKKCLANILNLFSQGTLGNEQRLRILLLYLCMINGVSKEDHHKITEAAQLSLESSVCFRNFEKLGLLSKTIMESDIKEQCHRYTEDPERFDFFTKEAKCAETELSRFQPYLKHIMKQAIQNTLHKGTFQYVTDCSEREPISEPSRLKAKSTSQDIRAQNKKWDFDFSDDTTDHDAVATSQSSLTLTAQQISDKPILVVFVLGGVTLSETRVAYEISRLLACEVLIGGSCILTPKEVLDELKRNDFSYV